jgi:hypothetical protein
MHPWLKSKNKPNTDRYKPKNEVAATIQDQAQDCDNDNVDL